MMLCGLGSGFGWIWMLAFWAVVIGAVVWVATWLSTRNGTQEQGGSSDARSTLDERFARGEIDEDEHRRIRNELSS